MRHLYKQNIVLSATAILASIYLLVSCFQADENLVFVGRIDGRLTQLLSDAPSTFRLEINSGGGFTVDALEAAKVALAKEMEVTVRGRCLSACSEFILPAGDKIVFIDSPLIGFHWSPLMDRNQFELAKEADHYCAFTAAGAQERLYDTQGINKEFWREAEKRLVTTHYRLIDTLSDCPDKSRGFLNRLWLPTSEQLREKMGLVFEGKVCADDHDSCVARIDQIWDSGDRIVVGDTVHVVQ
ncbi:hypothetical protein [uncultured Algimonas sp.]|uniref:hypothetical protein n=1 Tax=uncultured Algimonas sp. TaxID=1547920 RepID=UPI00260F330E|nr:hypothetical protein [uncultured Algimonas sp.]